MILSLTLVKMWDEMVASEIGEPPSEVADWADYHLHRFIAFREIARAKRDHHHSTMAIDVIKVLRSIFDHHRLQAEIESRMGMMTGRSLENASEKLAMMKAKNSRVRKPLSWLHTKISTAGAAASKFV